MQLTERLLNDAGGWQVMKHARTLHGAGRVSDASYSEDLLKGYVREGETQYRAGLKILSKTNMENLCTCRDSKQRGVICAHSVAVGLEVLKPSLKAVAPAQSSAPAPEISVRPSATLEAPPPGVKGFSTEEGVPVELHVVIPPNFIQASARGVASLGIEAATQGKRVLLHALNPGHTYQCSAADMRLLEALAGLFPGGGLSGMLSLNTEALMTLLEALTSHPRVTLARRAPLSVSPNSVAPSLFADSRPNGDLALRCELPAGGTLIPGKKAAWFFRDTSLQPVCSGLPPAYLPLLLGEVVIPAAAVPSFLQKEWGNLAQRFDCNKVQLPQAISPTQREQVSDLVPRSASPLKPAFLLRLEGSLNFLTATLQVGYGDFRTTLNSRPAASRPCDPLAEAAALRRLSQTGFSAPDVEGQMVLRGEPAILEFFARQLPELGRLWKVELGERFQHVTRGIERIEPTLKVVGSGANWFEMDVALETAEGERYSGTEIRRLIQSGRSHLKRKDGGIAVFDPLILDEFDQVLRDCNPDQRQPGRYRIANRQAAFVEAFAQENGARLKAPPHWREWALATRKVSELRAVPLGALDDQLRLHLVQEIHPLLLLLFRVPLLLLQQLRRLS